MSGIPRGRVSTYDERALSKQLSEMEKRQKKIEEEDPRTEINNYYKSNED